LFLLSLFYLPYLIPFGLQGWLFRRGDRQQWAGLFLFLPYVVNTLLFLVWLFVPQGRVVDWYQGATEFWLPFLLALGHIVCFVYVLVLVRRMWLSSLLVLPLHITYSLFLVVFTALKFTDF
jgi:hypothetical protein